MGWGGGNDIVEPVVRRMVRAVNAGLMEAELAQVLAEDLIGACQTNDWDTEHEVLWDFATVPWVVAAFAKCGVVDEEED